MPSTPRGIIDYPAEGDTSWYSTSDGLEEWLSRAELLGIPTYETFSDLPTAGSTKVVNPGATQDQRQFAAVKADKTVYRDDGTEWVPWLGSGTTDRPVGEQHVQNLHATQSAEVAGLESPNAGHPGFTQDLGQTEPERNVNFEWSPFHEGFHYGEDIAVESTVSGGLEGVAYGNGHIYHGEDAGTSDATIWQFDAETGNWTGWSMTTSARHTNSMVFYDGELYVGDGQNETDTTYIVDVDSQTVVDTITRGTEVAGENFRGIVPDSQGKPYMIHNDVRGSTAHLVDLEGARADGTTTGNIYQTFRNGGFQEMTQDGVWKNGYYYYTTHRYAAKVRMPFADQIGTDYALSNGSGQVWLTPQGMDRLSLEGLAYNPDLNEWYVGHNASPMVIQRAHEKTGLVDIPEVSAFSANYLGPERPVSMDLDATSDSGLKELQFASEYVYGFFWCWLNDMANASTRTYMGINNPSSGNNQVLAIHTGAHASNYVYTNADISGWIDTGIARPAQSSWVKLGIMVDGNQTRFYVAPDGLIWQLADTVTTGAQACRRIQYRAVEGRSRMGTWHFNIYNRL